MMIICCVPTLLIAVVVVVSGVANAGAIVFARVHGDDGCGMMAGMGHGEDSWTVDPPRPRPGPEPIFALAATGGTHSKVAHSR